MKLAIIKLRMKLAIIKLFASRVAKTGHAILSLRKVLKCYMHPTWEQEIKACKKAFPR